MFEEFQAFRRILCLCPCCGEIVRMSDLQLKHKGPTPKTWLDEYETKYSAMTEKENKFDEIKDKLREKATEKGRKEAVKVFNDSIDPKLKALKLNPYDIKPILNPVDFVVFNGMENKGNISNIIFLSKAVQNPALNDLRIQVDKAIKNKKYEWQVARIDEKGNIELE